MSDRDKIIENPREVFEKEGSLFDHIDAMYEKSIGFEHYWQNRRKDLVLTEMSRVVKGGKESLLDVGCAEGLFTRAAVRLGFELVVGLKISRIKLTRASRKLPEPAKRRIHYVQKLLQYARVVFTTINKKRAGSDRSSRKCLTASSKLYEELCGKRSSIHPSMVVGFRSLSRDFPDDE